MSSSPCTPGSNLRRSARLSGKSKSSADGENFITSGERVSNDGMKKNYLDFDYEEGKSVGKYNPRVLRSKPRSNSTDCAENGGNLDTFDAQNEGRLDSDSGKEKTSTDLDSFPQEGKHKENGLGMCAEEEDKDGRVEKRITRSAGSSWRKGGIISTSKKEGLLKDLTAFVENDLKFDREKKHVLQDEMGTKGNDLDSRQNGEKKESLSMSSGSRRRSQRLAKTLQGKLDSSDMNVTKEDEGNSEQGISQEEMDTDQVELKETDLLRAKTENMELGKVDATFGSGGLRRRSERLMKIDQVSCVPQGKSKGKSDVDLNFPPSHDDEIENGIKDSPPVVRFTKRKFEGSGVVEEQRADSENGDALPVEAPLVPNNAVNGPRRYTPEEKGKASLVKDTWLSIGMDPVDLDMKSEEEDLLENAVSIIGLEDDAASGLAQLHDKAEQQVTVEQGKVVRRQFALSTVRNKAGRRRDYRQMYLDVARERASHFAHFNHEEEEEDKSSTPMAESEESLPDAERQSEDWPGPFSTAMKIIRDRDAQSTNVTKDVRKHEQVINWMPSVYQGQNRWKPSIPSLQEMCLEFLAKNADALVSLDNVPDVLRNKLSQLLCDSRRMDSHFVDLLARGSPTEIRVKNCSCITEEQIIEILGGCDMKKLTVLQLDLCGRCMPDYILRSTLARSPNNLNGLVAISLRGACRLSDSGLRSLTACAPSLRSINLGQCSLITSTGINAIADSLGLVVRELYLDDCQNIDATLILPALKKLEHLEVLSVAGIQTVSNNFIRELVAGCGANIKELVLKNCGKLTDISVKAIADNCSGLCALDVVNLRKLTDSSLGYLANGCQSIQMLKLCRNAFSDDAVAAYVEACGETLIELSLNNVKEVGHNTAISVAKRCSRNLLRLDLSFCRRLADEALGLIVDSCSLLRVVKLFGCTQITNKFLDGHSNPSVQIIGLKMSPITKHRNVFESRGALLRYSSVEA